MAPVTSSSSSIPTVVSTAGDRGCVAACPAGVLEIITDDYDDLVSAVAEDHRKKIKYSCAPCKPERDRLPLPCVTACPDGAITHSW